MRKLFFFLITLFLISATSVSASEKIADASAAPQAIDQKVCKIDTKPTSYSTKYKVIKKYLELRGSPLAASTSDFIASCQKYSLDCYLLPAISGLESSYGTALLAGSYNPFGWGGGYLYFKDWKDAIDTVGRGLRENYIGQGSIASLEAIGAKYAASPTWASRVGGNMSELQKLEDELNLQDSAIEL